MRLSKYQTLTEFTLKNQKKCGHTHIVTLLRVVVLDLTEAIPQCGFKDLANMAARQLVELLER